MVDRYSKKDVIKRMILKSKATGYDYYHKGSKRFAKDNSGPWSSKLETTQAIFPNNNA